MSPNKINVSAPVISLGIDYLLKHESMPSPRELNLPLSQNEELKLKESP